MFKGTRIDGSVFFFHARNMREAQGFCNINEPMLAALVSCN